MIRNMNRTRTPANPVTRDDDQRFKRRVHHGGKQLVANRPEGYSDYRTQGASSI